MADFTPATGVTISNPMSGAQLAAWLNALAPFVLSSGYGATVPTNATAGQIWAKNTGGTPDAMIHDGTDDFLLYSVANILGTVSADGSGENTGAILEIGETSGTLWVKFAGGLAICAAKLTGLSSGTLAWSLPVTFTDTAKMFCVATGNNTSAGRIVNVNPSSTSQVTVYQWNDSGSTADSALFALVVGFWTEEFV